jgi:3-oxoacyl-(acyl-carrier-protein) synthase
MSVLCPIGSELAEYYQNLIAGKSAICAIERFPTAELLPKVAADLSSFDIKAKLERLGEREDLPKDVYMRAKKLVKKVSWATKFSILTAIDLALDSGFFQRNLDPFRTAIVVATHNSNQQFQMETTAEFNDDPNFIDPLFCVYTLDTDHATCISEVLGIQGPIYTVGGGLC